MLSLLCCTVPLHKHHKLESYIVAQIVAFVSGVSCRTTLPAMATKRDAPTETAARPAKKYQGVLPPILTEAVEVLPQAELVELLKTHVLPGITRRLSNLYSSRHCSSFASGKRVLS